MLEYYPQVKLLHILAVTTSGSLFALRGLLLHLGAGGFAMSWPVRFASYAIDTVLLTAALMLFTMLPHAMFANGWLALKLMLLPVYVVLGSFALKPGRTARLRVTCWLAALAVYATMFGIARAHHPLGWLGLIGG
jgi:uncharacterized membrane protein SirB2